MYQIQTPSGILVRLSHTVASLMLGLERWVNASRLSGHWMHWGEKSFKTLFFFFFRILVPYFLPVGHRMFWKRLALFRRKVSFLTTRLAPLREGSSFTREASFLSGRLAAYKKAGFFTRRLVTRRLASRSLVPLREGSLFYKTASSF